MFFLLKLLLRYQYIEIHLPSQSLAGFILKLSHKKYLRIMKVLYMNRNYYNYF